jgi:hypothetical protein
MPPSIAFLRPRRRTYSIAPIVSRAIRARALDAALHELPNHLGHVSIVSPEPVDPADNEDIATAEQIEQPLALTAFGQKRLCF